jgi:neutral trehalase
MAWNTIFDPTESRVVTTVGRLWNREYGGWCLFGWDNFFISYVSLLFDKQFAIHNCIEHLKGVTDEGFIANDHRGNGTWSWDRSQPIVGSLMVDRIYKATEDITFLKETYPYLLRWNEWYFEKRMNGKLLSYGSHKSTNLYNEPHISTTITAKYESGMDDSPMYDGIKFNSDANVLEMWDVGLNSLYLKDCELLIRFAKIIGEDYRKVEERYNSLKGNFDLMWSEKLSAYVNVDTAENIHLSRVSPTIFYPMLLDFIPKERVSKIISNYFNNSEKFGVEFMLPSVAVDDKDYQRQRYWRGSIWPPLSFLTYLGFCESHLDNECKRLAESSWRIFDSEWRRKHYVCENYCSINGLGDDERISSDRFHTWGVLMAIPKFMEKGFI